MRAGLEATCIVDALLEPAATTLTWNLWETNNEETMPERRLPDGRIQIYEEEMLGLRVPILTMTQALEAVRESRRERHERRSTTASPETKPIPTKAR